MAVAFLLAATSVSAEVLVRTTTNYYDVDGQTAAKLRAQMKAMGPRGYWGYTKWRVNWSLNCVVTVKLTYTYPRIKDRSLVPARVLVNWDAMIEKLVIHEEGHAEITVAAANRISAAKCKKARQLFDEGNRLNKAYDIDTDHGHAQGVRLSN